MNYFDTLEKKRKHIAKYSDKIPPKESVERALWKAWKQHQVKTMQWHIEH